jgi:hypothetical protein
LKNLLQDSVTHAATLARRYNEAHQKPGQSVATFVSYLNSIEAELPEYSDQHRHQHLLVKLKPELRRSLQHYQDMPTTCAKLIELATQLEAASGGPPRQRETGKALDRAESRSAESSRSKETKSSYKGKGKAVDKSCSCLQSKPPTNTADSKEKERLRDENGTSFARSKGTLPGTALAPGPLRPRTSQKTRGPSNHCLGDAGPKGERGAKSGSRSRGPGA